MSDRKDSLDVGLSKSIVVCGIKLRKAPNGQYFKAMNALKALPLKVKDEFFKGMEPNEVYEKVRNFELDSILELIINFILGTPDIILDFLSELMEVEKDVLENVLTPTETIKVVKEFWKLNELDDFLELVKPKITHQLAENLTNFGFKI